ncbi:Glycerate 2-kinase [compost metagenome]
MRILIAPDTFKESLTAAEAARAIARGLQSALPDATLDLCPLSDGGEGFVETLVHASAGRLDHAETSDARGRPIQAAFGVLGDTVAIELSAAAGLAQIPPDLRDPLRTTTTGVGELIAKAYARHAFSTLLLAVGGSATVDGGVGLLEALGVRFLDASGEPIPRGGGGLKRIARIDSSGAHPVLKEACIRIAVDVSNPLLGPRGAAPVYGPQKGASPEDVRELEAGLANLADRLQELSGVRVHDMPGTGAAGGVAAGLVTLAGARMEPGFELVAKAVGLDERLNAADWILTGEGQLDRSSFEGKVVGRLSEGRPGARVIAIAGSVTPEGEALLEARGGTAFSLVREPMTREAAMAQAEALIERTARAIAMLLRMRPRDF